jgi:molybdopterin-biosynthesis enzyme MoeA-like protein
MNAPENQQRLQMGFFPQGCEAVPNPFNRIPGFFIHDHTFVPGFPVMAWPMLESMLDTRYAHLHNKEDRAEHSFIVYGLPESRITPALEALEKKWPSVKAFSLPSVGEGGGIPHIELGVKGDAAAALEALEFLRAEALRLGARYEPPVTQ